MRLTSKATHWRWCLLSEDPWIHFGDEDEVRRGRENRIKKGYPRYTITISRVPKRGKREAIAWLSFNDKGEYEGIRTHSSLVTKKELNAWATETIEWLSDNGYAEQ